MILPCYLHSIFIVFTSFTGCEDGILKVFLICTFKDKNLAENKKKLGSAEPVEPAFCNSECKLGVIYQKTGWLKTNDV